MDGLAAVGPGRVGPGQPRRARTGRGKRKRPGGGKRWRERPRSRRRRRPAEGGQKPSILFMNMYDRLELAREADYGLQQRRTAGHAGAPCCEGSASARPLPQPRIKVTLAGCTCACYVRAAAACLPFGINVRAARYTTACTLFFTRLPSHVETLVTLITLVTLAAAASRVLHAPPSRRRARSARDRSLDRSRSPI